jgi:hypothetical protein
MQANERIKTLGIVTDEDAMYELLSKFLKKEGYETRRVIHDVSNGENCALIIFAPARGSSHSKDWLEKLKNRKPTLLVVQSYDEDLFGDDENIVKLSEGLLDLKQLSETIKRQLSAVSSPLS